MIQSFVGRLYAEQCENDGGLYREFFLRNKDEISLSDVMWRRMVDAQMMELGFRVAGTIDSILTYIPEYLDWFVWLVDGIKETPEDTFFNDPGEDVEVGSGKHFFWMMLLGMFGDWGTSINHGWIDKPNECIDFLSAFIACQEEQKSWEEE